MPDLVYLNGKFVLPDEAKISVFDHGFLYGDGLFETMRSYNSRVFLLDKHLDRLEQSAREMGLALPFSRADITMVLQELIKLNGPNLYIRLTVSRGPGPVGIDPGLCHAPTVAITSRETKYNEHLYEKGARAVFVKTLRNLSGATWPEIKSLNFLNNIMAKREVIAAGADEGFMMNFRGHVAEGTVSNIFIVEKGRILTPSFETGILPGITRAKVIELAGEAGYQLGEQVLDKEKVLTANEVFFTNSGSEIVPVTLLDDKKVGTGTPGEVTMELLDLYRRQAWQS